MYLELNESQYTVAAEGLTIQLLGKEFALLQFLYRNRERTFSREQLLDKVWPQEYPVDRTVDDHIYRLRKKLGGLQGLEIRTVRGFGYSLTIRDSGAAGAVNLSAQDAEMHAAMREIFVKYHQYGQGRSMITLARQQVVLGYEMDPFYSVYVHFVQGDLEWLLNTDEVPLRERIYWLLLMFMFSGEPKTMLVYCEMALRKKIMPPDQHREMEILNILDLYVLAGEPERALKQLAATYAVLDDPDLKNFFLPTATSELFVHLVAGTEDQAELKRMLDAIEAALLEKPYLREIGGYKVVRGILDLRRKEWRSAEILLDEGLRVLDMSGFASLRMFALHRIYHCCLKFPAKETLRQKYTDLFEEEKVRLGLNRLAAPLEAVIRKALNIL